MRNIATTFFPRSYCQTYSVYPRVRFCLSAERCTGALNTLHATPSLSGAKGARLHSSNSVAAELNPVDYGIWSVLQEKVYQSRIHNLDGLKTHLIDEWARLDQSIVDAAIDQWRHRLRACVV